MPRPPILPTLNWSAIFDSGKDFNTWISEAESPENAVAMQQRVSELKLEAAQADLLASLPRPVYVVAIAEDWCGDVVRHVPALACIAAAAPKINVRYITREAHKDVFVRFLTNGGEAIPKFIFLNDQFVECGNWGPMSEACRKVIARGKACGQGQAAREKVNTIYECDPGLQQTKWELMELVVVASCEAP